MLSHDFQLQIRKGEKMNDDLLKLAGMIFLENTATLICFTVLSIVFGHWWIVLFSMLFMTYIDKDKLKQEEECV